MQRKEAEEARARKKQAFLRCVDFLAMCRQGMLSATWLC